MGIPFLMTIRAAQFNQTSSTLGVSHPGFGIKGGTFEDFIEAEQHARHEDMIGVHATRIVESQLEFLQSSAVESGALVDEPKVLIALADS